MFKFNLKFLSSLILAGALSSSLWAACATNIDFGGNEINNVSKISAPSGGNITISGYLTGITTNFDDNSSVVAVRDIFPSGQRKHVYFGQSRALSVQGAHNACSNLSYDGSTSWVSAALVDMVDPAIVRVNSPVSGYHYTHLYGGSSNTDGRGGYLIFNPVSFSTTDDHVSSNDYYYACVSWH